MDLNPSNIKKSYFIIHNRSKFIYQLLLPQLNYTRPYLIESGQSYSFPLPYNPQQDTMVILKVLHISQFLLHFLINRNGRAIRESSSNPNLIIGRIPEQDTEGNLPLGTEILLTNIIIIT